MNVDAPSAFDIYRNIYLSFEEPIASIDTAAIHMEVKVDSLWQPAPFFFMADSLMPRQYQILADWQPEQEYQLTIDSLAFIGIYGLHTDKVQQTVKVKKMDEYGTILLNIKGAAPQCCCRVVGCEWKCIAPTTGNGGRNGGLLFLESGVRNIIYVCLTTIIITEFGIREIMIRRFSLKRFSISRKFGK